MQLQSKWDQKSLNYWWVLIYLTSSQSMPWTINAPHRSVGKHRKVVSDRQGQSEDTKLRFFTGVWVGQTRRTWEDLQAFALWPCKQQIGRQQVSTQQATGKQTILESVWDESRAEEGGKINVHWVFSEELSKWQQASIWYRGLGHPFNKNHERKTLRKEESWSLWILRLLVFI